jgi:putative ABC transport system permease protein
MSTGRFARWLSGWRVAIRIARRDARQYKWRSALIVLMVGLPVLLLTGGTTLVATQDVSLAESVPRLMGSAQARVSSPGIGPLVQSPDGQNSQVQSPDGQGGQGQPSDGGPGKAAATPAVSAVPGFAAGSGWTTSKLARVTGGHVISAFDETLRISLGDRRVTMPVLRIDARDDLARGMTDLVSGRWAGTASEIVVTEAGTARGLPRAGTITAADPGGKLSRLTVVGVATGHTQQEMPLLVGMPVPVTDTSGPGSGEVFLLERAAPVTWSEVRRLNGYGLLVQSRSVFLNPPSAAELDPQIAQSIGSSQSGNDLVLLIAAVGLFIETTLLAGPAFAVSAARQRRSLALAASNGAEARQLRRYVLGQALVLGVASAVVAVAGGVLLTLVALTWWEGRHADFDTGPFEVSWSRVVGVLLCSVVASVVAALIPAKGIARLDIVSVLSGRGGDRKAHRGLPVVGVAVMALSAAAIFWSVASGGEGGLGAREYLIVGGAIALVLGCLMVIPALLALVGRLGTRAALPLRLAARDTARQRGRSTPAVAAIMAAVAALTALSIGAASDTRQRQLEYRPQLAMGRGQVFVNEQDEKAVRSVFRTYAPDLALYPLSTVGSTEDRPGGTQEVVAARPPGCSDTAVFGGFGDGRTGPVDRRCVRLGAGVQEQRAGIAVLPLVTLSATVPLSGAERQTLQSGGILVFDPALRQGGYLEFVTGQTKVGPVDAPGGIPVVTGHQRVPAAAIDRRAWQSVLTDQQFGAWMLPATASKLGWPVALNQLEVISPTGMIPASTEAALKDHLDEQNTLQVERGFQNDSWLILLIMFLVAGLLVLVASLISTALSLAESQNDMATLAAVGATRRTRRGVAASQAFVVAACGCLLGLLVGMVPGIAITWPLTVHYAEAAKAGAQVVAQAPQAGPLIEIPWLPLVGLVVLVPLVAAGLAWLAVRRLPQMTRRLA